MDVQTQIDRINQNVANTYAVLSALGADMPTEQNSDNLSTTAGSAKALLYSEQSLTATQKAQARTNIGITKESWNVELEDGTTVTKVMAIISITLYTFTVDGTEYKCEAGMTWGEWVESDYNTDGFYVSATDSVVCNSSGQNVYYNATGVADTKEILNGVAYTTSSVSEPE